MKNFLFLSAIELEKGTDQCPLQTAGIRPAKSAQNANPAKDVRSRTLALEGA